MPYIRVDPEMYDEIAEELGEENFPGERPSGGFEYESAEAKFKWAKLGPVASVIREALLAAKARAFRVRYDGGNDEGFSHPDFIQFDDGQRVIEEVAETLVTPELIERLRQASSQISMWGNAVEMYANATGKQAFNYAMDEFAHELASRLLGDGFGTGEYELYGAFTADLESGEIVDHEDAAKPAEME